MSYIYIGRRKPRVMNYEQNHISLCAKLLRSGVIPEKALLSEDLAIRRATVYAVFKRQDVSSSPSLYDIRLREKEADATAKSLVGSGENYFYKSVHVNGVYHNLPVGTNPPIRLRGEDKAKFFQLAAEQILKWDEQYQRQAEKAQKKTTQA